MYKCQKHDVEQNKPGTKDSWCIYEVLIMYDVWFYLYKVHTQATLINVIKLQ